MKKYLILFDLVLLFAFTTGAMAADYEFVGGVTYNTFAMTDSDGNELDDDDLKSGIGFYGGILYWVNEQLAVGGGYESASSKYTESGIETKNVLSGPYGNIIYRLNDMISLNGGVAFYTEELGVSDDVNSITIFKSSGMGFLVGADLNYPIKENITITGNVGYRFANLPVKEIMGAEYDGDEKLNLNGFRAGAGVNISF